MSNWIFSKKVLQLNANWMPIGTKTLAEFVSDMSSSGTPKKALQIEYETGKDGNPDFSKIAVMIALSWKDWIELKPRSFDENIIHTPKMSIRVPTVGIVSEYNKMPTKRFIMSRKAIYERDGGICAYSGEKLSYQKASLDHVTPQSKAVGGKVPHWKTGKMIPVNSPENVVTCDRQLNVAKGNKTLQECGFELLYEPKEPSPMPVWALIKESLHPDWRHFLINKKGDDAKEW